MTDPSPTSQPVEPHGPDAQPSPAVRRALLVLAVVVPFLVALVTWIGWQMNLYPGWFGYVLNAVLDAGLLVLTIQYFVRLRSRQVQHYRQSHQQLTDLKTQVADRGQVLETVLAAFSDVIVLFDRNGRITYANDATARVAEVNNDTLVGADTSVLNTVDQSNSVLNDDVQAVLAGDDVRRGQIEFDAAGDTRIYEYIVNPLADPVAGIRGAVLEGRDITERSAAEQALRESENRFRAYYKNLPIATYTWRRQNGDFALIDYNDAAEQMTKGVVSDRVGMPLRELYAHADDVIESFDRCVRENRTVAREITHKFQASPEPRTLSVYFVPLSNDEVMTHTLDITERKKAEESVRRSQQQLSAIINNTPNVAIQGYDGDGRVQFWNPASESVFGYSREQALGRTLDELMLNSDDAQEFVKTLEEIASTGEPIGPVEWSFNRPDGEQGTVTSTTFPIHDQQGHTQFICMDVDVTERRRSTERLKQSERHLRNIIDGLFAFVKLLSLDGRIIETNRAPLEVAGLKREDVIGKLFYETPWFSHSRQEQDRLRDALNRAAAGETVRYDAEIRTAGGTRMVLDVMFGPLYDENGEVVQIIGCAVDITARRQMEQALREHQARLQLMLDQLPAIVWSTDPDLRFTSSTGAGLQTLNIRPDVVMSQDLYAYFDTDDPEFTPIAAHRQALRGESVSYEIQWAGRSFLAYVQPLRDEQDQIIGCLGLAHDVTEQKHAIGALRESEQRFRQLAEHINEVFWLTDWENNRVLYISPLYETVWGQSCQSLYDEPATWADPIHPDDRERVFSRFRTYAQTGEFDEEYRIVHSDGSVRWIHDRAFPIHDAEGRVYRVAGLSADITERKEAEQRRNLMLRELDHRVKNTLNAVLSIASQTGAGCHDVDEFIDRFMGRVRAMARAHEMLARTKWQGVELGESVQQVIRPYLEADGIRLQVHGDPVTLPSDAATPVSLALHELATNAAKHGVFAGRRGSLEIAWHRTSDGVELTWAEFTPDVSTTVLEKGLGIRLIEGLITYQLHGRVDVSFENGLQCTLYIPLHEPAHEQITIGS